MAAEGRGGGAMKRTGAQGSARPRTLVWRVALAVHLLFLLVLVCFYAEYVERMCSSSSAFILSWSFLASLCVLVVSLLIVVGGFYWFTSRHLKRQGLRLSMKRAKRTSRLSSCLVVLVLVFSYLLPGDRLSSLARTRLSAILVGLVVVPFVWWMAPKLVERRGAGHRTV